MVTLDYIKDKVDREYKIYKADDDAEYEAEYTIDLSQIKPTVAFPHLPENARTFDDIPEVKDRSGSYRLMYERQDRGSEMCR